MEEHGRGPSQSDDVFRLKDAGTTLCGGSRQACYPRFYISCPVEPTGVDLSATENPAAREVVKVNRVLERLTV